MADPTPLLALDRENFRSFANRLDVMGGLIATFAPDDATTDPATLTFGYRGGRFVDDLGGVGFEPDGTIVIPNNVTRYVQFDPVNGVTLAAALDPLRLWIAEVRTGSAAPSGSTFHIEDLRDMNLVTPNRMRWRGDWAAGDYARHDVVVHDGVLYVANTATSAEPPDADWDTVTLTGGGGGVDVEDEGTLIVASPTATNYVGDNVVVTEDPAGVAKVTILGSGAAGELSVFGPLAPAASPDAENEEFESSDGMSWVNQGTASVAYHENNLILTRPADSGNSVRVKSIPNPTGDYRYQTLMWLPLASATSSNFFGFCLRESATGKLLIFNMGIAAASPATFNVQRWTDESTFGAGIYNFSLSDYLVLHYPLLVEFEKVGSNISVRYSRSIFGGSYQLAATEVETTVFTTGADEIGYHIRSAGGSIIPAIGVASFLRKLS